VPSALARGLAPSGADPAEERGERKKKKKGREKKKKT